MNSENALRVAFLEALTRRVARDNGGQIKSEVKP
jgi:hypothetical protein